MSRQTLRIIHALVTILSVVVTILMSVAALARV